MGLLEWKLTDSMAGWSFLLLGLSFCKSGLWHLQTLSLEHPSCQTVLRYKRSKLDVEKKAMKPAGTFKLLPWFEPL